MFGQETGVLYLWKIFSGNVWKNFGDKDTQPKYKGQVENGKPNGQGTYTNPDGEKYVGEWKDGEKHSKGTFTFTDGRQNIGEYKNDKEWNVKHYNTYGKYIGSWVNGVWQN